MPAQPTRGERGMGHWEDGTEVPYEVEFPDDGPPAGPNFGGRGPRVEEVE